MSWDPRGHLPRKEDGDISWILFAAFFYILVLCLLYVLARFVDLPIVLSGYAQLTLEIQNCPAGNSPSSLVLDIQAKNKAKLLRSRPYRRPASLRSRRAFHCARATSPARFSILLSWRKCFTSCRARGLCFLFCESLQDKNVSIRAARLVRILSVSCSVLTGS